MAISFYPPLSNIAQPLNLHNFWSGVSGSGDQLVYLVFSWSWSWYWLYVGGTAAEVRELLVRQRALSTWWLTTFPYAGCCLPCHLPSFQLQKKNEWLLKASPVVPLLFSGFCLTQQPTQFYKSHLIIFHERSYGIQSFRRLS